MSERDDILRKLRHHLETGYGATFNEGYTMHFFHFPYFSDSNKQLEAFALDSAYAAVAAPEHVVAFRAYVQMREYKARLGGGWVFLVCESADYFARLRLEDLIKTANTPRPRVKLALKPEDQP